MGKPKEVEAGERKEQIGRVCCRACTVCFLAFLVVIGTAAATYFYVRVSLIFAWFISTAVTGSEMFNVVVFYTSIFVGYESNRERRLPAA